MDKRLLEIEQSYKEQLDNLFARDLDRSSRWSNWAGDLGFPCDTFQAACRLKGEIRPRYTIGLKKIFRVGIEWEDPNYQLIKKTGIKIIDRIGKYSWKKYKIAGKLDFRIEIPNPSNGKGIIIPFEHKTCSPNSFRAILKHKLDGESLTRSKYPWVRKYPGQLTAYNLMEGSEYGMWFFFQKVSGDYFFWLLPLDYEYGEELIKRAARCNRNVSKNVIPAPTYKDICSTCDFAPGFCFPDRKFGPGFKIMDSDELEAKIRRYKELDRYVAERNALHKELIGKKDNPGLFYGENVVLGNFLIESKQISYSGYTVKPGKYWQTSIKEIGGEKKDD